MESYYDVIVCNPPWIPSGVLNKDDPLEYSVYDEDATLLKNVLAFSKYQLRSDHSSLILFYSDMGEKLGLQSENTIEEKCAIFGLSIKKRLEENLKVSINDPLHYFKQESKVFLYEIKKG